MCNSKNLIATIYAVHVLAHTYKYYLHTICTCILVKRSLCEMRLLSFKTEESQCMKHMTTKAIYT